MTVLAASETLLPSPVSPELVLVSPPEVARLARAQLPELLRRPVQSASRAERTIGPRRLELVAVYLFCLFVTLGPLLFTILLSDPVRHAAAP